MIKFVTWMYILGLFALYFTYCIGINYPDWTYYTWEKTFGCSVFVWYTLLITAKKDRKHIVVVLCISIVRFSWQALALFVKGIEPGDSWVVALCFMALLIGAGFILFRKEGTISKFLTQILINERIGS